MKRQQTIRNLSLGGCFISAARKNWHRRCIADLRKTLNYGQTLTAAIALSRKIDAIAAGQDKIAVMLPPSVGAVLTNLAITISSRIMVNLNYTLSAQIRTAAVEQCGIKCVITSKEFLKKANLETDLPGTVFIEDLVSDIKFTDKIRAYIAARFLPAKLLTKRKSETAAIIFSSGTTGVPKGIMLSHHNILSNINSIREVMCLTEQDNLCAVLPFFHSFGFTCGLWLPLIIGGSAVYIANPFDVAEVGTNARRHKSTVLFAPPAFLSNYARRIEKSDFVSLRLAASGAEKLQKQQADMFEEKFGLRPLEGYGATELSPVASLNFPGASKEETVGKPLPDVEIKIMDPDTGRQLWPDCNGLIMVRGPNVMEGYFDVPEKTAEVLKDGWYNTGDIGCIDKDGFLKITGRLARFSKIGGEMVPHIAVEQVLLDALGTGEQLVAVTSVPDEKKGEELVVLYLEQAGPAEKLHELISKSSLPNLWKPRANNYIMVKEMPTLGSGKLDIAELKKIAKMSKNSKTMDEKVI
jgi:acyl-[acyl-carrier-protein]-phospholipid O-acyltransferase/long-chain-fatty-acid--[acyl-carrier-protein] ligase